MEPVAMNIPKVLPREAAFEPGAPYEESFALGVLLRCPLNKLIECEARWIMLQSGYQLIVAAIVFQSTICK